LSSSLIPSFILTFREALEAALVIAIAASYLRRVGKASLNRHLYSGAVAAVGVSVLLGVVVFGFYGGLSGVSAEIFEGIASLIAALVLTYMILWMTRRARTMRTELEHRVEVAVTTGQMLGIVALSFVAVFREGLETVLFLTALAIADWYGTLVGAAIASLTVIILAAFLMRGIYRLDTPRFFQVTSVLLIVFAAGLSGYAAHELLEAAEHSGIELGILGQHAFDINPLKNQDGTYPLLHEKGAVGSVLAALVGYDGNPEWMRVIVYLGYWLVLGAYVLFSRRRLSSR